jgi:hypothetical protein
MIILHVAFSDEVTAVLEEVGKCIVSDTGN